VNFSPLTVGFDLWPWSR